MKELPIGIQNFESLRRDNYLYVDKTEYVYKLVTTGRYYFLSRPRRFGKSMLISTLHAYFEGKKELFDGLAISELEQDWVKYPVLHLDLNQVERFDEDGLRKVLNDTLVTWEEQYGKKESELTLGLRFKGIVRRAAEKTGHNVVILIDEYDKPLLQSINDDDVQERIRAILKSFYSTLKSADEYIRFALLTGVTKFSKVSIFSDLNNLEDISMVKNYATVCGITDEEIDTVLQPYVQRLVEELDMPYDAVREELRQHYDGYHFTEELIPVYNPFSVLNVLKSMKMRNYWFETGTPTFLAEALKKNKTDLQRLESFKIGPNGLRSTDLSSENIIPLIYQSGYLTIKGYQNVMNGIYTLGFPNKEVEESFLNFLLPRYSPIKEGDSEFFIWEFIEDVRNGNTDGMIKRLKALFADTPYDLIKDNENHYQNVMFIVTKLMGFYVQAEYKTSEGRIDMVLQTDNFTYVMEFKFDGTAEETLQQINDKSYTMPFEVGNRKVIKIGLNFSAETRNIEKWVVE